MPKSLSIGMQNFAHKCPLLKCSEHSTWLSNPVSPARPCMYNLGLQSTCQWYDSILPWNYESIFAHYTNEWAPDKLLDIRIWRPWYSNVPIYSPLPFPNHWEMWNLSLACCVYEKSWVYNVRPCSGWAFCNGRTCDTVPWYKCQFPAIWANELLGLWDSMSMPFSSNFVSYLHLSYPQQHLP